MKISTLTALATLLGSMALPMVSLADGDRDRRGPDQSRDRNNGSRRDRDSDRRREDSRGDKDRRNDNRRDSDRRDSDRRDDRRNDDQRGNDRRTQDWRNDDRQSDSRYNQGGSRAESDRRQDTKNDWRNIAYGAGAVAVLGLLKKDNTLTFAGAAGALYSLSRYEQDRKSQNSFNRGRAAYFGQSYFVRDGVRFDRKSVNRNGERYYQFVRGR